MRPATPNRRTMKAWQRQIREQEAEHEHASTLLGDYWTEIDTDLAKASVRSIDYRTARTLIERYEWLGNMGTTEHAYGLYHQDTLAGVVCFGRTAGTNVYASVCGSDIADQVITLCRGACTHWAHPHAASHLIAAACRDMGRHGYNVFIAYADTEAGEIGTVYQASGWLYAGQTTATEKFEMGGKVRDARLVSAYARDRRGGKLRYHRTRAEQKAILIAQGAQFFTGQPKHRYIGIYGPQGLRKRLRSMVRWETGAYPKRAGEGSSSEPPSVHEGGVGAVPAPRSTQQEERYATDC